MARFDGKTVLVTGASSGIGRACALRLGAEGARVVLVGRRVDQLKAVGVAGSHIFCALDLTDPAAVQQELVRLKSEVGPIDGWLLAAGVHAIRPLMMESYASIESILRANVLGTLGFLALALKARMVARAGAILLLSSIAATAGGPGLVAYAASKGALEAATRSLALELASQVIRVNALAPGVVRSPMSENYLARLTREQSQSLESDHPLGFGTPEDLAACASFMLSDEARWITGAVIAIDGGFSAR